MFPAPRFFFRHKFLTRLARSVWKRYARTFKGPWFVERRMGALWLFEQHNIIDRYLFCVGVWEEAQVARLTDLARKLGVDRGRPIFLDIGSHAGFYAVLMAKTGLFSEVVACEPLPAHLAQLQANLLLNDLVGAVTVHAAAASDKAGTLRFAAGPPSNRGTAHALDSASTGLLSATPPDQIIEVDARRMDDLAPLRGGSAAIKIDVEGHEALTLTGMRDFLAANRCVLQVEILSDGLAHVSDLLRDIGYRPLGAIDFDHYFTNAPAIAAATEATPEAAGDKFSGDRASGDRPSGDRR